MRKPQAGAETPASDAQQTDETPIVADTSPPPPHGGAFIRLPDGTLQPEASAETDKEA